MLQRAMGALALVGGALLGEAIQIQVAGGASHGSGVPTSSSPTGTAQKADGRGHAPATLDTTKTAPKSLYPAASFVRGATEAAQVGPPLAKDARETQILAILEDLDHHRQGTMNVPREDGRMLRLLTEAAGARNVVEIGTSNGYSGLWFCLALEKTHGHLTTFDIDEGRFEMARANFKRAGVEGLVTQVLGDAHQEVTHLKEPIDVLFIDADKEGYLDYLTKLLPLVRPGGLILSHNMASPYPDPKFVKAITTSPELDTLFVHMHDQGLGVSIKKR